MLIIEIKEVDTIDKVLRRFKKKFEKTQTMKELRRRKAFEKPSITNRQIRRKAVYKLATYGHNDD